LAAVPSIGRAVRVERASAPEGDLTRALYEEYANQIFRYCLHQLGSREEAEDAVQSTFLNAFRGIKRGIVPELESAWLFKIAHNVCLSRRRSTWRRGRIESTADFEVVEELTPAPSRRADELMGLQDVLEGMPESQRRAILLREWQGLSYREIADELDLSQGAVETLIFRARRALAAGLEEPPEPKRRLVRGVDLGNVLAGLKTLLLGGGAAVKVAATVAVVSAGTVVAVSPVVQHQRRSHTPQKRVVPVASLSLPARAPTPQARPSAPAPRLVGHRSAPVDARPPAPPASTPSPVPAPEAAATEPPPVSVSSSDKGPGAAKSTPTPRSDKGSAADSSMPPSSNKAPSPTRSPSSVAKNGGPTKKDPPGQSKQNNPVVSVTTPPGDPTPAPPAKGNNGKGKAADE
jgi:RNA polymerase sigma factor (sigma-70 family)